MGIDHKTGRMKREGPVGIKPRPFIVSVVQETISGFGVQKSPEVIESIFREVDLKTFKNIGNMVRILEGVEDFLKQAKQFGIRLAVATSDMTLRAEKALLDVGIGKYFEEVVGGDRILNSKPHPEMAELILSEMSISASRAVMIGDHPVDIQMGNNAHLACEIGVLTGLGTVEDFKSDECVLSPSFLEMEITA